MNRKQMALLLGLSLALGQTLLPPTMWPWWRRTENRASLTRGERKSCPWLIKRSWWGIPKRIR